VSKYQGVEPFHLYLKGIFQQNKNWGSNDRKNYRRICYTYWRYFDLLESLPTEEIQRFLFDLFSGEVQTAQIQYKAYEKFAVNISNAINQNDLNNSFIQEAPVFFRVLDSFEKQFIKEIEALNIKTTLVFTKVYKFQAQVDLSYFLENGYGYIQDLSSQMAMEKLFEHAPLDLVWDCCSGAGGKSIDLMLKSPKTKLFCSDMRQSVLENLKLRFKKLGLKIPQTQEIDLLKDLTGLNNGFYNQKLIIADAPCTGSGTWRRNPENIAFFTEDKITRYSRIQESILNRLNNFVMQNGYIFYMTCSVFYQENEVNSKSFAEKNKYHIVFESYFGGFENDADFIYGCLMQKK
jgi:16S rRNA (cytosine967-C5)-methyltransferase